MLATGLLDAVRAEISEHEAALAKLREIERLAVDLTAPDAPAAAAVPKPAPKPSPSSRRRSAPAPKHPSRADVQRDLLSLLSTRGPLSPRQLADASGLSTARLRAVLAPLIAAGRVSAFGSTASRLYDIARPATNGNGNGATRVGEPVALGDRVLEVLHSAGGGCRSVRGRVPAAPPARRVRPRRARAGLRPAGCRPDPRARPGGCPAARWGHNEQRGG